jgi:hypothetical protein
MADEADAVRTAALSDMGAVRPGTLELVFDRKVKIESIHAGLEAAVRWHGCEGCGMNGLDLRFRVQDPMFEVFNNVEGLRDINVYR